MHRQIVLAERRVIVEAQIIGPIAAVMVPLADRDLDVVIQQGHDASDAGLFDVDKAERRSLRDRPVRPLLFCKRVQCGYEPFALGLLYRLFSIHSFTVLTKRRADCFDVLCTTSGSTPPALWTMTVSQ